MGAYPYFRQRRYYSCGAACLRMAFAHHGVKLSEKRVARMARTSQRNGTPRRNMIDTCLRFGFSFHSYENASLGDLRRFLRRRLPVIVNYIEPSNEEDHYALLTGAGSRFVVLNDPWNGRSFRLSRREFMKRWWGWRNDGHCRIRRWTMVISERQNN